MNRDTNDRRFRFIQATGAPGFRRVVAGWLELAEQDEPGSPKALLEELHRAYLPDGTCFVEVSFKVEHRAVERVISQWARTTGRAIGRVDGDSFVLDDGRAFALDQVRFAPRPAVRPKTS